MLDENSPSIKRYLTLEQMLLTDGMNTDVCAQYPELQDVKSLEIQLRVFNQSYNTSSLCEVQENACFVLFRRTFSWFIVTLSGIILHC